MLTFPQFDPVALAIGPISIHWYGVMYIIAFCGAWALASYRGKKIPGHWNAEQISDLVFVALLYKCRVLKEETHIKPEYKILPIFKLNS